MVDFKLMKGVNRMLKIIQEAVLPKLSQTSLYSTFDKASNPSLSESIKKEIRQSASTKVDPESIKEILALIRLNGDPIAKKAVDAYRDGKIVVLFNKETSTVPPSMPYIVINSSNGPIAYIFAQTVVNNIQKTSDYVELMAVMEAAYLALLLHTEPETFLMNSPLMLTLCNIYTMVAVAPIEQKLYMKGDNLNKAMIYFIVYFYHMIREGELTEASIPYKRIMLDKIDPGMVNTVIDDVLANDIKSFMDLIKSIKKINPIRYENLDSTYMTYFVQTCGVPLVFSLENIQYLFLAITSAYYKSKCTSYSLNKLIAMPVKKAITLLTSIVNS